MAGVPAHRVLQALAERDARRVPHRPQGAVIKGVAPVVALAVRDAGDHVPARAAAFEQRSGQRQDR